MIAVIGTSGQGVYCRTMNAADEVQSVAATLERPGADYRERLERARAVTMARSGEAARQLGVFAERVRDLTLDELLELYDETFGRPTARDVQAIVRRLMRAPAEPDDAAAATGALVPILDRLEAVRNPFAYAVRALCCVLLARPHGGDTQSGHSRVTATGDTQR
jgi:nitrate reductase assembly molybdenum cofactor insertion protein NarJ